MSERPASLAHFASSLPPPGSPDALLSRCAAGSSPWLNDADEVRLARRGLKWQGVLSGWGGGATDAAWLKRHVRKGIPAHLRAAMWCHLVDRAAAQGLGGGSASSGAPEAGVLARAWGGLLTSLGIRSRAASTASAASAASPGGGYLSPPRQAQVLPSQGSSSGPPTSPAPPSAAAAPTPTPRQLYATLLAGAALPEPSPAALAEGSLDAMDATMAGALGEAPQRFPCATPSPLPPLTRTVLLSVGRDLGRTFPHHPLFSGAGQAEGEAAGAGAATCPGQRALGRLLVAYARGDASVGYCQGMNFVAAFLLMTTSGTLSAGAGNLHIAGLGGSRGGAGGGSSSASSSGGAGDKAEQQPEPYTGPALQQFVTREAEEAAFEMLWAIMAPRRAAATERAAAAAVSAAAAAAAAALAAAGAELDHQSLLNATSAGSSGEGSSAPSTAAEAAPTIAAAVSSPPPPSPGSAPPTTTPRRRASSASALGSPSHSTGGGAPGGHHARTISATRAPPPSLYLVFLAGFPRLNSMFYVLAGLVRRCHPAVAARLETLGVTPFMWACPWLMTLFTSSFPLHTTARIWDAFLHEGWKVPLRVALALVGAHREALAGAGDLNAVMEVFRGVPGCRGAREPWALLRAAFAIRQLSWKQCARLLAEEAWLRECGRDREAMEGFCAGRVYEGIPAKDRDRLLSALPVAPGVEEEGEEEEEEEEGEEGEEED